MAEQLSDWGGEQGDFDYLVVDGYLIASREHDSKKEVIVKGSELSRVEPFLSDRAPLRYVQLVHDAAEELVWADAKPLSDYAMGDTSFRLPADFAVAPYDPPYARLFTEDAQGRVFLYVEAADGAWVVPPNFLLSLQAWEAVARQLGLPGSDRIPQS